jgi:hypothetical protein
MRFLNIQARWVPPSEALRVDRSFLPSESLEGDGLQPAWFQERGQVEAAPHPEALRRIGRPLVLVLPLRCVGMGRVLMMP